MVFAHNRRYLPCIGLLTDLRYLPFFLNAHSLAAWLSGSDFHWPMTDLWLTCDQYVGKVSDMGQPTRPTQPSIH